MDVIAASTHKCILAWYCAMLDRVNTNVHTASYNIFYNKVVRDVRYQKLLLKYSQETVATLSGTMSQHMTPLSNQDQIVSHVSDIIHHNLISDVGYQISDVRYKIT